MKISVISDIHIAKKWDKIEKIIPKNENFLNPNNVFKKLLSQLKRDNTLIWNWDLIDYYYSNYYKQDKNNWDLFSKLINKFKWKILLNPWNHDYRMQAYNFSISWLDQVNINTPLRLYYKNLIKNNKFRYLWELDSILVNENNINPFLKNNLFKKKFSTYKNTSLLLLNTGPDWLNSIISYLNPLNLINLISMHPSSLGLSNNEIILLKEELLKENKKELILFLHCPPFFSKNTIPEVKLTRFLYKINLIKNKLNYCIFLKNNWNFIELLMNTDRNITVVTSHTHMAKQYIINKTKKTLKESNIWEINKYRKESNYIKFISTLPLGAIWWDKKIGYLAITDDKIKYKLINKF